MWIRRCHRELWKYLTFWKPRLAEGIYTPIQEAAGLVETSLRVPVADAQLDCQLRTEDTYAGMGPTEVVISTLADIGSSYRNVNPRPSENWWCRHDWSSHQHAHLGSRYQSLQSPESYLCRRPDSFNILYDSFYELQKFSERKTSQTMSSCSSSVHC